MTGTPPDGPLISVLAARRISPVYSTTGRLTVSPTHVEFQEEWPSLRRLWDKRRTSISIALSDIESIEYGGRWNFEGAYALTPTYRLKLKSGEQVTFHLPFKTRDVLAAMAASHVQTN